VPQFEHDVLPVVVLYVPASHVVHALAVDEPVLAFLVPAGHAVRPPVEPYATLTAPGQYPPASQVSSPELAVFTNLPAVVLPEQADAAVAPGLDVV